MRIDIINGPNLNLLGVREPEVYGNIGFDTFLAQLKSEFPSVDFHYYQSNVEGELINYLHDCGFVSQGIILNAGGYTHTSVAISDAVASISSPVVEVHISNIYAREAYRHNSLLSRHCKGIIAGFGLEGYRMAISYFLSSQG